MALKKILVENFKSFRSIEAELGNFNVLIGPNASGKSNFVQIFKFIKEIIKNDISDAVDELGGSKYFLNGNTESREFKLEISFDEKIGFRYTFRSDSSSHDFEFEIDKEIYQLILSFEKNSLIQKKDFVDSYGIIIDRNVNETQKNKHFIFKHDKNGGFYLEFDDIKIPIVKVIEGLKNDLKFL